MSSRHTSPAFGVSSSVNLDTLEALQDKWIQRYEKSRRPPPPPQLNSPRSVQACAMCRIDPSQHLQKFSLRQQLNRVMGADIEDQVRSLTNGDPVRARVAMQGALHTFQQAGIGLGTSQEKLVACHAFEAHEAVRLRCLAAAQEARRQIMTDASHPSRGAAQTRGKETTTTAVSRVTASPNRGDARTAQRTSPLADPSRPHEMPGLTGTLSRTRTTAAAACAGAATPPLRVAVSPLVPYTPRNAKALNTSVFGNRTQSDTTCNPSGAYLSSSKDSLDRSRPRESGAGADSARGRHDDDVRRPTPTQKSLFPVYREEDSVVSLDSAHMDWALGAPTAAGASQSHTNQPLVELKGGSSGALVTGPLADQRESSLGGQSARSSSNRGTSVSPITHRERDQGIFYYCANPRPLFSTAA